MKAAPSETVPVAATVANTDSEFLAARSLYLQCPGDIAACRRYALACEKTRDTAEGIAHCEAALTRFPGDAILLSVLATLYGISGRAGEGLMIARRGLDADPLHPRLRLSAATLLGTLHQSAAALELLEKAPAPTGIEADNFLLQRSLLYREAGESRRALADLQQVLEHNPLLRQARSNFLLYLHDVPGLSAQDIFSAHLAFGRDFSPARPCAAPPAPSGPDRPLRLGFVSSDLRQHAVASFLLPVLSCLDRTLYHPYLYSSNPHNDGVTARFQAMSHFREIRMLDDHAARTLIRADEIDILFDLNGHTAHNRAELFLDRSAPVQINWLGYPDTSGIPTMDYRLVDDITDPAPAADAFASERLFRLPGGFLCYAPLCDAPAVSPPPCVNLGRITFGSFNNFAKASPELLAIWAELLRRVPYSQLMLKAAVFNEPQGRKRILDHFVALGISADRIIPCPRLPDAAAHLAQYAQVDIALDTFPYNGTTTTCEALYMGVPVVTLVGATHAARVGASLLQQISLEPLMAYSVEDYLSRATALAAQPDDLVHLRTTMRERLCSCALTNAPAFTQKFSAALRTIWQNSCRGAGTASTQINDKGGRHA